MFCNPSSSKQIRHHLPEPRLVCP